MQNSSAGSRTGVEQNTNNTTTWLGNIPGNSNDISKGQTFKVPYEGDLQNIEVFTSMVSNPGEIVLTLHQFDTEQKEWGPSLGKSTVEFKKSDSGKWMGFHIPPVHVNQGKTYGFKLKGSDSFIGLGEAAGSHDRPPYAEGQEWRFNGNEAKGTSFSYFSLAFKIGLRAA